MSQRCLEFTSDIDSNDKLSRPVLRPRMLSGIGLHLNSLSGFVTKIQGIDSRCESNFRASPACSTGLSGLDNNGDTGAHVEVLDELGLCEDSFQSSLVEELPQGRGRKRRRNSPDGFKRCSCKKSKCLKLYCECFAGGSYCSGACGCKNCNNKAEFEDVVHETREQVQSRNPLAFIPKVVASAIATTYKEPELPGGISKHKRGCNCKKSQCTKKYCECFQSEVGCSASCKCSDCMNSFGVKQVISKAERAQHLPVPIELSELSGKREIIFGSPLSSLLRGMSSTIASEDLSSGKDFDSPAHQTSSACNSSSTPLQNPRAPQEQVSPEMSVSRTATPEPSCQRQLRPRSTPMITRSQQQMPIAGSSAKRRSLPPGIHSLQSAAGGDREERDELPDFLQDPAEVQSATVSNSPKKKRVNPPQFVTPAATGAQGEEVKLPPVLRNGRKLTLQALPSLPPVSTIRDSIRQRKS